ncbi:MULTISPECIES: DUF3574 domain-containing protein [Nostocales]|uniref:DUF3574 domain-containing protein n=3 Tax=Nostocales TaxID=1161 RepID=A0A8S9T005_9CYAN|nr:DUF3574 domain-containing protein [Tolypothrix bouteillei]KAF3885961.1 DUF3574 domain-containing protein [Tolypothrix bouteillei VB521301]
MKFKISYNTYGFILGIGLIFNCALAISIYQKSSDIETYINSFCKNQLNGKSFTRTELLFGLSKSDGSRVNEKEFQFFIDNEVTPLFPDGLTLLTGKGQFKNSRKIVVKEGSKLLILLYPFNSDSNRKIQQIRQAYVKNFQQESVLRVDELSCVSF